MMRSITGCMADVTRPGEVRSSRFMHQLQDDDQFSMPSTPGKLVVSEIFLNSAK